MVWKTKLQPEPHRRYSARDLAKELNVDVDVVMETLNAIGEHVVTPAKKSLEEPVRLKVYEHLGRHPARQIQPVPPWERRGTSGPQKRDKVGASGRRLGDRDLRATTFSPKDGSVGLGNSAYDVAPAWEDASWALHGFTGTDRDAWRVFLRPGQAKEAAALRDAGFLPEDLGVDLHGWPVFKRLRAGETPAEVKRLLDRLRGSAGSAAG